MILCSLNGLQTISTVETMNFRILCFIKILEQNYSLFTISQNKRLVLPAPPPITFIEWMKFKDFYESLVSVTQKFINSFKGHWWWGGGGGGELRLRLAFYSVKLCVVINFSHRHNVLCFSFVVVFHSMYVCMHAIIKVVLLNEKGCHV